MSANGSVSLIHSYAHRKFGTALLSYLVLCFLCEPEQGNCLCYLVEFTGSCVCLTFDILYCFIDRNRCQVNSSIKQKPPSVFKLTPFSAQGKIQFNSNFI